MLVNSWPGSCILVSVWSLGVHWRMFQWLWFSVEQRCMLLNKVTDSFG